MTQPDREAIGTFIDAVVRDRALAARLLAADPSLLNARWIHGETVLHFLAVEGFAEGVDFLAARGADVNAVNEFGDSPLIDAAVLGSDPIVEILLRHGGDPNARSSTRDNVLHAAIQSGNRRSVALLLAAGADPGYVTDLGETVFDALDLSSGDAAAIEAVLADHGVRRADGGTAD